MSSPINSLFQLDQKHSAYTLLLCVFALGFPIYPKFGTWCLIGLVVAWLINKCEWGNRKAWKRSQWLFIAYFLLHAIGLSYSTHLNLGLQDIESKTAFLLAPIVISTISFSNAQVKGIVTFFIVGTLLTNLVFLIYALYQYAFLGVSSSVFFYANLTNPFYQHPAYISSYNIFALVCLINILFTKNSRSAKAKVLVYIAVFLSWFVVILYSGRMQIIVMSIILSIFFVWKLWSRRKFGWMAVAVIASWALTFGVAKTLPFTKVRVDNAISNNESKGNIRLELWDSAINVGMKNPIFGVGTGDADLELLEDYKAKGLDKALSRNLNAHNQYFQSFVALGILGLVIYILMLAMPLFRAWEAQNIFVLSFYLIFILGTLTECMMETQRGAVWLAVFGSLFWHREDFLDEQG